MMNKLISKRLVSILVVAVFMLSFAGVAVSQESHEAGAVVSQELQKAELKKMAGMISDIMPDIGQIIVVEKESGNTVTLTAGPDVSLKNFNVGDHVVVEYTDDVISSINKTE
ncbi:MAG: hypothetical protein KAI50_11455 [Desulfobacterales bacterium]|nr:hypothetical protein [Desulfobacterales bacterium]